MDEIRPTEDDLVAAKQLKESEDCEGAIVLLGKLAEVIYFVEPGYLS